MATKISKITPATLHLNPELAKMTNSKVHLANIIGQASGTRIMKDVKGDQEFECATGSFEGTNLETGEIYQSGRIFLPGGVHEMLIDTLKTLQSKPGESLESSVMFGVELWAVPAGNPRGYSWECKEMAPIETVDPLAKVRALISEGRKAAEALPAPEKPAPKLVKGPAHAS